LSLLLAIDPRRQVKYLITSKKSAMQLPLLQKQLLKQLADGKFHSGAALAKIAGLSRGSVWKYLQALSEYGLDFNAVTGKGYRLNHPLQLLDPDALHALLTEEAQQNLRMEIHDSLDSTNSYLMHRAAQGAPSGLACLSEYQTAGKGRRGRQWASPFGQNIYLSLLCRYQEGPATLGGLSLAVGVAAVRALQDIGVHDIGLKWPNDIYYQRQKLGGILVEVSGDGNGPCHAVIGIGLNLLLTGEQAAGIDQAWTDLRHINGQNAYLLRNRLAAALLNRISAAAMAFHSADCSEVLQQWRQYDCLKGLPVQLTIGEQRLGGVAAGIDEQGLLWLEHADGQRRAYASGEVSVKPA
jgi:BirA family transcriptional regulator, biotin operon repressor / biotin---[acetyl-CoA-carboxylase] ligase